VNGDVTVCEYPSRVDKEATLRIVWAKDGKFYLEWVRGKAKRPENKVTKRKLVTSVSANAHWSWARKLPKSVPHYAWDITKWRDTL